MTKQNDTTPASSERDKFLKQTAERVRALGKRVVSDVIEIGRLLSEAKHRVGHGRWQSWLDQEFGWTDRTARNFMRLYELAQAKSENFSDLNVSMSALYLLAARSTPDTARDVILERARSGEPVTVATVRCIVAEASEPEPRRITFESTTTIKPIYEEARAREGLLVWRPDELAERIIAADKLEPGFARAVAKELGERLYGDKPSIVLLPRPH
jgi:hypothetical protein